ncbi:XdhC family protein [Pendulispora albinea]|uniref:XdhC/CoxI family protein n=1 Tax=Pendulispora albinea TaxID=2741071 RepID=A0ABZ2LRX1_9BACT
MAKLIPLHHPPVPLVKSLAEPGLPSPMPADVPRVLEMAAERARRGISGAMATVIARHGSAPATPGQKLYVGTDGAAFGTVGGGAIEREVLGALQEMLARPVGKKVPAGHQIRNFRLGPELGMCCGGQADLLFEPIEALTPCLLIGAGHVATATAPLLARVGFAVTVCDSRETWGGDEGRIPGVRMVMGDYDEVGEGISRDGVVAVMTHDHALDQDAIEWALRQGFAYVGGVGSRAKAQRTRDRLEAKGFSLEDRERVRMPIGVDIRARLPEEIAVAIAAELIAWLKSR